MEARCATEFAFDNSFARDLVGMYEPTVAATAPTPNALLINESLALELGIDASWLASPEGVDVLVGNVAPAGAEPLAQAYSGHQFGGFSPRLGDGRALLVGEVIDVFGRRRDLHLKGSGRTSFARGGDGKAAVGPMLREYVMGEAMHALGIPTTRALAVVATGDPVRRETVLPGAVLARVAASHLRVGTFQFFAARGDQAQVRILAGQPVGNVRRGYHSRASMRQLSPLPMPRRPIRWPSRTAPASTAAHRVAGSATEPVLPSVSNVEKSFARSRPRVS